MTRFRFRFRSLPLALAVALAGGAFPAHAQSAGDAAATTQEIQLAVQPLAQALNALARQARMELIVQPALVEGKMAPAVSGRLTPRQALDRLLVGSGLVATVNGTAVVVTAAAPDASGSTLPQVTVTAQGERSATEGTGAYTTGAMGTATKLDLSPRETPQSVSVITRQQIDDQGATTLDQALRGATGITVQTGQADTAIYTARGFGVAQQYDGIADGTPATDFGARISSQQDDLSLYDRVEILRGAAGLTQGNGQPGGAINLVRKKPTREFQASASMGAGSWDAYRVEADVSGPLVASGALRGRLVAAYDDSHSFQNVVNERKTVLYGVLEADLTRDTTVSLGVSSQKSKGAQEWWGLPFYSDGRDIGLPRSTYFGADWNLSDRNRATVYADLEQRFANDWKFRVSARSNRTDMYKEGAAGSGPVSPTTDLIGIGLSSGPFDYDTKSDGLDLYATGPFSLLGRRHELVLGASTQRSEMHMDNYVFANDVNTLVNVLAWDPSTYARPQGGLVHRSRFSEEGRQHAGYATARLSLSDPLKLIVGARLSRYENTYRAAGVAPATWGYDIRSTTDNVLTPYAGLVYDIDPNTSVYASYADIFEAQNAKGADQKVLDPIVGANYEAGIKREFFDKRLNASLAVFRIEQKNRPLLDAGAPPPCGAAFSCYVPSGKVRSQGVETEVAGSPMAGWQLAAGYTYNVTKYLNDTVSEGNVFSSFTPRHLLRLSSVHRLPGALNAWTVGGALRAQSRQHVQSGTVRVEQKAYAVADLMVAYRISDKTSVQFNIKNLFDQRYWAGLNSTRYQNFYGEPRNLNVTLRTTF
ncbi:TonB-dependent siderophore receptor [Variovorax arabinosiphilus]|uniref:TonB-dependent siderophore receptor n=1 Tax=Variovorax arabinosiphilus TaxID=3053498 RepID=UPI0025782ACF|nr:MULTISPECIES: TonB-dependent receptor [unclassified Variovorax]MDM0122402.1 TonB-dependent siderophore receptor [Variovorax sp. J2L1-78]MDM0131069.1 TonB-dependent siderophore receptor [Variovorax sp. J2L1-63]MDM0235165.1 TonB-dependent siderophore receptor [Variovorax sp. J2R1-6]